MFISENALKASKNLANEEHFTCISRTFEKWMAHTSYANKTGSQSNVSG